MKRGQQRTGVSGFTIVETLIVLAVTGVLFIAIVTTWSGRQQKNQFSAASNDIRDRLQQVVSDVQSGYFPGTGSITCTKTAAPNLVLAAGAKEQGTNSDCVFLGKIVQFGYRNTNPEGFRVFSVAAVRNALDPSDFRSLKGTVLAPATPSSTVPNLSDLGSLLYGMTVYKMQAIASGVTHDVDAIGFLSRSGVIDPAAGGLQNGTQPIDLYAFPNNVSTVVLTNNQDAAILNNQLTGVNSYYKNPTVKICFQSGGTSQFALVTLGSSGRQLEPEMQVVSDCGM